MNSSYLAKFLRKTKRLSPPTGQASCTSTTNSWSSTPRSATKGERRELVEMNQASPMSHLSGPRHRPTAPCAPTHPALNRGDTPPGPSTHRSGRELAAPAFHTHGERWHPLPPPQTGRSHPRCRPSPPAPQELQVTWGKAGGILLSDFSYPQDTPTALKRHHPICPGLGSLCPRFFPFPKTTHVKAATVSRRQPPCTGGTPKNGFL